jgi:AAHS family 4-hydroxybenzoate transporter-like MFS transporter
MAKPSQTSIASIIDRSPLGFYRIGIVVVCFLIVLMDGFDTQAIGFAATAMSSSLNIPMAAFGQGSPQACSAQWSARS